LIAMGISNCSSEVLPPLLPLLLLLLTKDGLLFRPPPLRFDGSLCISRRAGSPAQLKASSSARSLGGARRAREGTGTDGSTECCCWYC